LASFILCDELNIPMQEQVQVERTLTFEEICPDFSQIVAENDGFMGLAANKYLAQDGQVRDIMECQYCVVGEAHDA